MYPQLSLLCQACESSMRQRSVYRFFHCFCCFLFHFFSNIFPTPPRHHPNQKPKYCLDLRQVPRYSRFRMCIGHIQRSLTTIHHEQAYSDRTDSPARG